MTNTTIKRASTASKEITGKGRRKIAVKSTTTTQDPSFRRQRNSLPSTQSSSSRSENNHSDMKKSRTFGKNHRNSSSRRKELRSSSSSSLRIYGRFRRKAATCSLASLIEQSFAPTTLTHGSSSMIATSASTEAARVEERRPLDPTPSKVLVPPTGSQLLDEPVDQPVDEQVATSSLVITSPVQTNQETPLIPNHDDNNLDPSRGRLHADTSDVGASTVPSERQVVPSNDPSSATNSSLDPVSMVPTVLNSQAMAVNTMSQPIHPPFLGVTSLGTIASAISGTPERLSNGPLDKKPKRVVKRPAKLIDSIAGKTTEHAAPHGVAKKRKTSATPVPTNVSAKKLKLKASSKQAKRAALLATVSTADGSASPDSAEMASADNEASESWTPSRGFSPRYTPDQKAPCIRQPHPHDVLCGRGNATANHPGNQVFRNFCWKMRDHYNRLSRMINTLFELKPPTRFLERDRSDRYWVVADQAKALEKISQALREKKWLASPPSLASPRISTACLQMMDATLAKLTSNYQENFGAKTRPKPRARAGETSQAKANLKDTAQLPSEISDGDKEAALESRNTNPEVENTISQPEGGPDLGATHRQQMDPAGVEVCRDPEAESDPQDTDILASIVPSTRISVFWPMDDVYYTGVVGGRMNKFVYITYDIDNQSEWIDLTQHRYKVLQLDPPGTSLGTAKSTDPPVYG